MKLSKSEINSNIKDIKLALISKYPKYETDYTYRASKKGNLLVQKDGEKHVEAFSVVKFDGGYGFISINGIDNDNYKEEVKSYEKEFDPIVQKVYETYKLYLTKKMSIRYLTITRSAINADISFLSYNSFRFSINFTEYKLFGLQKEERKTKLLNKFEKDLRTSTEKYIIDNLKDEIIPSLIKSYSTTNFGKKVNVLQSFNAEYDTSFKKLVLGKYQTTKLTNLGSKTSYNNSKVILLPDENAFTIDTDDCLYKISVPSYELIKKTKNDKNVEKFKETLINVTANIPYYRLVLSFLNDIEKLNCTILTGKAAEERKVPDGYVNNGICYHDTQIIVLYRGNEFPLLISIPHLQKKDNDLAQLKKDAKPILDKLIKNVKTKIQKIEEKEIKVARNNSTIYQSYAAKTICDFIEKKDELFSISRICDSLKKSYGKEEALLAKYSKDEIKKVVEQLRRVGLLNQVELKGTYGKFDTYGFNNYNTCYDLYFNDYKRSDKEIITELNSNHRIYPKEAEQVLHLISEEKIKEKDMACVFNLFKYHEFIIVHEEKIEKIFSNLSDNIKLYASFVVDEYPARSIEQRLLKRIAKSK